MPTASSTPIASPAMSWIPYGALDRPGTAVTLDADHRRHAVCEPAIRDLKACAGLAHLPSGVFTANAAWLLAATLAHNLLRWTATLGLGVRDQLVVAETLRRTLLALPRRLTRSARRWTLHLPTSWPWAPSFRWRWPGCAASHTRPDPGQSPVDSSAAPPPWSTPGHWLT